MKPDFTKSPAKHKRLIRGLITGVLLLNILVAGMVLYSLKISKNHHEKQAIIDTENISRVLNENISGIFQKVDITLQSISDEAGKQLAVGAVQPEWLNSTISLQHSRVPELLALRATDENGNALYGPSAAVTTTTSLAHRDYFKFLRDTPGAGTVISKPLIGGISGKWLLILARRINQQNGDFSGLVYAGIGIDYLTQLFKELNLGPKGSITLLDDELSLIAQYPVGASSTMEPGQKINSTDLLKQIQSGNRTMTYTAIDGIDGVERIYCCQKISGANRLYILTGMSTDDYLVRWRSEFIELSLFWGLFFIGSVVSSGLLLREWQKTWKAEQEILHGDQRFRSFVENASNLICTLSPTGTITYMAPNISAILGFQPEELMNTLFSHLLPLEEQQIFTTFLHQKSQGSGEQLNTVEHRVRHKGGKWLWFASSVAPLPDIVSSTLSFLCIGHDITNRKYMEEAQRVLNEELEARVQERTHAFEMESTRRRLMFDQSPDGIVIVDPETKGFIEFNSAAHLQLGYTKEEFAQLSIFDLEAHESREETSRTVATVLHNGRADFETLQRTKQGEVKNIQVTAQLMEIHGQSIYHCVWRDITEKKQTERALRENESRLKAVTDSVKEAIILMDSSGRIVYWNPAFQQIFGYLGDEAKNLNVRQLFTPPHYQDLHELIFADVSSNVQGKILDSSIELEALHKDGREIFIELSLSSLILQGGWHAVGVIRDVTENKLVANEKKSLQQQLLQSQKMEAIGTLAGGIAHDFNNILGAVLGYAEIAREDSPEGSEMAANLDEVLSATHRAADLVKQILTFSRQANIRRIPLQPAHAVKEAIKFLRPSLPSTITIKQAIDSSNCSILADPTQFHQILMNLCTNAFHAMEQTGGTLEIILKYSELSWDDVRHEPKVRPGKYIMLSIGDTGSGIGPEIRKKIFDPYFTTKEVGKGTGMGLAIAHGIVVSYGGFITCDSEIGKGTVFRIFFPAIDEEIVSEIEQVVDEAESTDAEHILLIDDEKMLVEMGKTMLERLGYEVTALTSSIEALAVFQKQPDRFDVIITDQTMPGMTGMDLSRQILQIRPEIPIILCTGYSSLVNHEQAKAAGIKVFADKPLTKKVIATLLRKVLDENSVET